MIEWLESLSPWPKEGFGTERMRDLLARLGDPQRALDVVHVVGTKGKSTATRRIARTIGGPAYTSPHVAGWHERLDTDPQGFERAIARVRADAEEIHATQFETVTAAALVDFVERGATVAAIEAGLGGRHDATNVVDARVVLLTNVGLEHTEVLGTTREEIAAEKLAVVRPGATAVLPDDEFAHLVPGARVVVGGAQETVDEFLGEHTPLAEATLPGRLEVRDGEVRDGAHTPAAVEWLLERLPDDDYALVVSLLRDKDADGVLRRLAHAGRVLVATQSSNDRSLGADDLAEAARPYFEQVEIEPDPRAALARGRELRTNVLVTGSLYLLADLADQ